MNVQKTTRKRGTASKAASSANTASKKPKKSKSMDEAQPELPASVTREEAEPQTKSSGKIQEKDTSIAPNSKPQQLSKKGKPKKGRPTNKENSYGDEQPSSSKTTKNQPSETKTSNETQEKDSHVSADSELQEISKKTDKPKKGMLTDKKNSKGNPEQPSSSKAAKNQQVAPPPPNRSILQLKVTLHEIQPPIWRRIQVFNNTTFANLHNDIMEAMGWQGHHSCQFYVWNEKKKNNLTIEPEYFLEGTTKGALKMGSTKLSKFLRAKGDAITYCYDLGDSWMHQIIVERVLPPPPPKAEYPKCKAGARACPPEDCGGVNGYNHLVEVYKNPEHEEYEELITDWLGENFPGWEPEKFEKSKIFRKVWVWMRGP